HDPVRRLPDLDHAPGRLLVAEPLVDAPADARLEVDRVRPAASGHREHRVGLERPPVADLLREEPEGPLRLDVNGQRTLDRLKRRRAHARPSSSPRSTATLNAASTSLQKSSK